MVLLCWGALLKEQSWMKDRINLSNTDFTAMKTMTPVFSVCEQVCGYMPHRYMLGMFELFAASHFQEPFLPSFQGNSDFRHRYLLGTLES